MRRMLNSRLGTVFLALLLALGAAVAVIMYIANYRSSVHRSVATVPVVVANRDIPPGTTGEDAISKGYLVVKQIPLTALSTTAVQSTDALRGRVAATTVYAG